MYYHTIKRKFCTLITIIRGFLFKLYQICKYGKLASIVSIRPQKFGPYTGWDSDVTILSSFFLKKGDVVYDVGANLGALSIAFGRIVGETGHVFAFEPNKIVASTTQKNIKLNKMSNIKPCLINQDKQP